MVRFLRFLLALAALPFAWGLSCAFLDVFRLIPAPADAVIAPGALALFCGMGAYLVVSAAFPVPVRLYVLGHELTHAVVGLFFGARPSNLKVGLRGGSVTLTKSNVWITLAPYFFPFYTILVVLAALAVRAFLKTLPFPCAWLFAVGFTWCFHAYFTIRSLCQRQPDAQEYGYVFSYVFIWIFNVFGAAAWIVCTTGVAWRTLARCVLVRATSAYVTVGDACVWLYESVRSLPVLQG